jgi:hypothetical protein
MDADDLQELSKLLPLINSMGQPFFEQLSELLNSSQAAELCDASCDLQARAYQRHISNGLPPGVAAHLIVNEKTGIRKICEGKSK